MRRCEVSKKKFKFEMLRSMTELNILPASQFHFGPRASHGRALNIRNRARRSIQEAIVEHEPSQGRLKSASIPSDKPRYVFRAACLSETECPHSPSRTSALAKRSGIGPVTVVGWQAAERRRFFREVFTISPGWARRGAWAREREPGRDLEHAVDER